MTTDNPQDQPQNDSEPLTVDLTGNTNSGRKFQFTKRTGFLAVLGVVSAAGIFYSIASDPQGSEARMRRWWRRPTRTPRPRTVVTPTSFIPPTTAPTATPVITYAQVTPTKAVPTPTSVAPTSSVPTILPTSAPTGAFPSKTSTGVQAGVTLTQHAGSYTLSSGTYEGVHFTQPVYLSPGSPIVFRNCRFTGGEGQFGAQVTLLVNRGDVTFDRSDFDGGTGHTRGILTLRDYRRGDVSSNLTVTNSRFLRYGAAAVESSSDNVLIEGNYMEEIEELHDNHADGVQIEAGNKVTIRNNTIFLNTDISGTPDSDTAPIAVMAELGNVVDVVIENNLIAGGAFAVYMEVKGYTWTGNAIFRNNRISTQFYPQGGRYGVLYPNSRPSQLVWTGNVFHESGATVNK